MHVQNEPMAKLPRNHRIVINDCNTSLTVTAYVVGAPLVSVEDVLDLAALLGRAAPR